MREELYVILIILFFPTYIVDILFNWRLAFCMRVNCRYIFSLISACSYVILVSTIINLPRKCKSLV